MKRVKTVIHVHTDYSPDCNVSLESLAWSVANERVGCIAITDHDTIEGARRFRGMTDATVIIGEEISTRHGHLIGLFLEEHVPPGMSVRDTALAIRDQGGLVLVPHPFVRAFACGLRDEVIRILDVIDAVEINNAQNVRRRPDRRAARFAREHGLAAYVGADTHLVGTLAPCYQILQPFSGTAGFLNALAEAELYPGRHSARYFAAMGFKIACTMAGLSGPQGFGRNAGTAETAVAAGRVTAAA